METTEEIMVRAPKVLPFKSIYTLECPACGEKPVGWFRRMMMALRGAQGIIYNVRYCAGGKAPTEQISSPIEMMVRGRSENDNPCAGVYEPHLHLTCKDCGMLLLMWTKEAAR